jgi:glucose-6-phosphate 1-dehydrogenase
MGKMTYRPASSDALVLFGVTGDLAHKMIFPALYAMANRDTITVPVIGVASTPWKDLLDRLAAKRAAVMQQPHTAL